MKVQNISSSAINILISKKYNFECKKYTFNFKKK